MQRSFFIFFLTLIVVNISFWTIQFQNESELYQLVASKKEVLKKQCKLFFNSIQFSVSDTHSFPSQTKSHFSNHPFENEDEDKYEVEKESLIGTILYSLDIPITNNPFAGNTIFSYDRSFFNIHFLDIFSPPPNC